MTRRQSSSASWSASAISVGDGPLLGGQMVLAGPGHGERITAGQGQLIAPEVRVAQIQADPPGETARPAPGPDHVGVASDHGARQRGRHPAVGAQVGIDLADVVEQCRRHDRRSGLGAQRPLHPTSHPYRMASIRPRHRRPQLELCRAELLRRPTRDRRLWALPGASCRRSGWSDGLRKPRRRAAMDNAERCRRRRHERADHPAWSMQNRVAGMASRRASPMAPPQTAHVP